MPNYGHMKTKLTLLLVPTLMALTLGAADAALAACLGAGDIQQAKNSGQILPLETVSQQAGVGPGTGVELLGSKVCERDGALVYELSVLDGAGNARTLVIDAASGARLN